MKKFLSLILALIMVLSLVACSSSSEDTTTEDTTTEDTAADPAAVTRLIVWDNAVLDLESSEQTRGDETRVAYAFADVIAKCEITGTEPCQVIGADLYAADEAYDDLVQKYLTMEGEDGPIVVGEAQDPDWAVWNVAYVRIGSDVIMTAYQEEISLAKVFEEVGMVEAESYDFVCADGYVHNASRSKTAIR